MQTIKAILSASLILSMFMMVSCGHNNPSAPQHQPEQGKMTFSMAVADNIASGTVTIKKDSLEYAMPIVIENHTGTVVFSDIQIGTWAIAAELFDATGLKIYSGTGNAAVTDSMITKVTIQVVEHTGTLIIDVNTGGEASISCTIDLLNNTDDCDSVSAITLVAPLENSQAVAKIDLSPTAGYRKAKFELTYGSTIAGWTFNLGDSSTNDGYGGDGNTQWNDSEFQILNTQGAIYASDFVPNNPSRLLQEIPGIIAPNQTHTIEVSNEKLNYNDTDFISPYIFALAGQDDPQGINYDIYVGMNRVINNSSRNGSGLEKVKITLIK